MSTRPAIFKAFPAPTNPEVLALQILATCPSKQWLDQYLQAAK